MAQPKLRLYTYWRSSASHRVRIALGFKGLTYEPVFVNLLQGDNKKPEYRATSPMGYLPTLEVDGTARYVESVAIIELLEELVPEPALLPRTKEDRARARSLAQIVNAGIQPLQNLSVLDQVGEDKEKRLAWLRHFIGRGLTAFEALATRYAEEAKGTDGPFAFGDSFTIADAFLLPQIYAARRYGIDIASFPRIARADEATKDLPFVKAAYPDAQPDAQPA